MSELALLGLAASELAHGRPYLEREEHAPPWHDEAAVWLWHSVAWPVWRLTRGDSRSARAVVAMTRAAAEGLGALDDAALRDRGRALRAELRRTRFGAVPSARFFAIVREAAGRVIGQRHYDSQVHAGWLLLQGTLAEMATGEGKTFAATLPAAAAALAGLPVHVVTVNDYLAARDAQTMAPLYNFFGLRCGAVVHGQTRAQRRQVYAGDITYCSNKELAFDYLRDRTALGDRASPLHRAVEAATAPASGRSGAGTEPATVLRGLSFAIVDEADSVFIDEARTPLILSATVGDGQRPAVVDWALARAASLREGRDYTAERALMRVRLSDAMRSRVEDELDPAYAPAHDALWPAPPAHATARECAEKLTQALVALHLYRRDQHYLVVDGKVQIVDESTGRVMADRAWERGLHQLIEAKEQLQASGERATLARITYQRFFRRYLRLAGMTGTATEVAREIGRIYRLPVSRVPLHRPSLWRDGGARCLRDAASKWETVVAAVQHRVQRGQPVLVGTRTVQSSEELSKRLVAAGIEHVVLNAKHDLDEAAIIGRAGQRGTVTVATNMAGRGTDIALGEGVAALGGLHVILTEYHDSPRVDRQFFGRAARQGDPGSGQALVAVDDELFTVHAPGLRRWLLTLARRRGALPVVALALLRRVAQILAEWRSRAMRMESLKYDRRLASLLAFSGRGE